MVSLSDFSIGGGQIEKISISIFIFVIILVLANVISLMSRKYLARRINKHNSKIISLFIQYGLIGAGIYFGMYRYLNFNLTGLAASLGILTIAIAFSSQQLVQNFIAGMILTFSKTIEIGDIVDVGPGTGLARVRDITLMRLTVRDLSGKIHSLANSTVLTSRIINYTDSGFIEIPLALSLPYTLDISKTQKIILDEVRKNQNILPNVSGKEKSEVRKLFKLARVKEMFSKKFDVALFEPTILITGIVYPKVNVEVRFWIRATDKRDSIVSEFYENLMKRFDKEKISLG